MSTRVKFVPLSSRICTHKSKKLCPREGTCKCIHLDGASTCHNIMNGTPCDETCEGFAHTYEEWDNKNKELEEKLPRWTRTPKYVKFWADIEAEKAHIDEMLAEQIAIEAEQDAFALADAEHTKKIQAAAEEFFDEQEQIELLTAAFKVPQTPKKPSWAEAVKKAPGAPKKSTTVSQFPPRDEWAIVAGWADRPLNFVE